MAAATLKFLGTAGARHVVSKQLRHSGGLWWRLGELTLWVDPGPGALVRALTSRPKLDPAKVDVLLLTHRHLDHSGDANAVVEAMTGGGFKRRGVLLAPADALDDEPVVWSYAQRFLARVERIGAGSSFQLAPDIQLSLPLAHKHGVETYGYRIAAPGVQIVHVVDTAWLDALPEAYREADLLIVNTTRTRGGDARILHLGADDAERLIGAVRPRLALLTHFGMQMVAARPDRIAEGIAQRTGIATLAARDGQTIDVAKL
jgi:ribonuclease BN (tRNA processing enzyme)